jgi:hypothetical protein
VYRGGFEGRNSGRVVVEFRCDGDDLVGAICGDLRECGSILLGSWIDVVGLDLQVHLALTVRSNYVHRVDWMTLTFCLKKFISAVYWTPISINCTE